MSPKPGYEIYLSEEEARGLVRVVLQNRDFPDVDFVDAVNDASDAVYRLVGQMASYETEDQPLPLSEETRTALRRRRSWGSRRGAVS